MCPSIPPPPEPTHIRHRLRTTVAKKQGVDLEDILANPLTQRILAAHARDGACANSFTFRDLLPSPEADHLEQHITSATLPSMIGAARPGPPKHGKNNSSSRGPGARCASPSRDEQLLIIFLSIGFHRCNLCVQGKRFATRPELRRHQKTMFVPSQLCSACHANISHPGIRTQGGSIANSAAVVMYIFNTSVTRTLLNLSMRRSVIILRMRRHSLGLH